MGYGSISKKQFLIQYPNTPKEKNIGVNYSSRLSNLEDIKNKTNQIDKIKAYVTKNLQDLKSEIINTQKTQELTKDYKNVIKQRQSARWINTKENRGNKSIMTKENFLKQAKELNIQEITTNTSAYEAVFILLKRLGYLDKNISTSKSISRKNEDEKQKFLALVKFQSEEQAAKYSTTTAKDAGIKTLEIDGIIGGGTLKALIENYKQGGEPKQNTNNETTNRTKNTPENGTEDSNKKQEVQETINTLPDYQGITINDTHTYIQIEGYGKTVSEGQNTIQIDEKYGERSDASLGTNSYQAIVKQEQFNTIKVDKENPIDPTTRIYYKKSGTTRNKINNFQQTIQSKKENIEKLTDKIKSNGEKINQAKTKFETSMNSIFDNTKKSRRHFQLSGGSFGNFENQNLFDDNLTANGIKKLSFKKNRLTNKLTTININFNYNIKSGFTCKGQEKISNNTTLYYERDQKQDKLIINEKEEILPDTVEEMPGLTKDSIDNKKLKVKLDNKQHNLKLKNFVKVSSGVEGQTNITNTLVIDGRNYVLLKDDGLWIIPVKFNKTTKKRIFDTNDINQKYIYKVNHKQIGKKDRDIMTEYQLIQKLKTGYLSNLKNQNLVTQIQEVKVLENR